MDLTIDPERTDLTEAGIPVRARLRGVWGNHDIAHLTRDSLIAWLNSGVDHLAEGVVLTLLGHHHNPRVMKPDAWWRYRATVRCKTCNTTLISLTRSGPASISPRTLKEQAQRLALDHLQDHQRHDIETGLEETGQADACTTE